MKKISNYIIERKEYNFLDPKKRNEITVFDIDDTLVFTKSKIKIHDTKTGERYELTPQEFNDYIKKPHHEQDFSDFSSLEILKAGKLIDWVVNILKQTLKKKKAVGVITARGDRQLIKDFLMHIGFDINIDFIFAINDPRHGLTGTVPEKKKEAFKRLMELGFNDFRFFDDSKENIDFANQLADDYPNIKMYAKHIKQR
tara:strand:- start:18141 stop:18737 length:597 start_codon:yes stop_codon:yes gene_type:complete